MTDPAPKQIATFRVWPIMKWILFAVILAFVSRRAWQLWASAPKEAVEIEWGWLIPAGLAYVAGWIPSVWFWRALLRNLGQPLGHWPATRAYYVGHLGKYIPGKALVLVIRAALIKDQGVNPMLAGAAAGYETLVFMATGAALAIAFAPFALTAIPLFNRLEPLKNLGIVWPLIVIGLTFATTPFSAWLFTRLCRKIGRSQSAPTDRIPSISPWLVCQGIVATALGWICHAFSLGFVLQALSRQPFSIQAFLVWLVSTTLSTVSGFVILIAPGGVGVREGMLIETLKDQPEIGPQLALMTAAFLRIVWFASELAMAVTLIALGAILRRDSRTGATKV